MNFDRTVHGKTADGGELVRYDRAGKLYVEYGDGRKRRNVKLSEAAQMLAAKGAEPFFGRYGGKRIDAEVRKAQDAPWMNRKCPSCGQPGWNGVDQKRRSYSGCSCCGSCL